MLIGAGGLKDEAPRERLLGGGEEVRDGRREEALEEGAWEAADRANQGEARDAREAEAQMARGGGDDERGGGEACNGGAEWLEIAEAH